MTPGWRRWAAILTTCTCLVAGALPSYRIRVPPPGQLVALSGDDLRVELDLPPPGIPIEAPITRRQGDADSGGATGGRVRRDGELWIELVDMEIEDERIRRKKEREEKRKKEEAAAEKGRRWRREEEGEILRREIAGEWNRVDIKGKIKEKQEKKSGTKRYGWVAGGVRPKGMKESVVDGKGDDGGRWREDNRSGKWASVEEVETRRQKTEGKIWWKSWRGKGAVREGRKEEGDGKRGEERGKEEEGSGESREESGNQSEEEGKTDKDVEIRRGMILESTLVSRGWHDLQSEVPATHRGLPSPHSTLSLTFPASHFTHGGLYVVRLVGTGRMVASTGTQRPQRATPPGGEPEETQTRSSEYITRRAVTEGKKNSSLETEQELLPENQAMKPTESEENSSEINTQSSESVSPSKDMPPVTQNPPSSFEDAKDSNPSKAESDSHMFSRIVETLENRFRWNEKFEDGGPSLVLPDGQRPPLETLRSPTAKRRKRELPLRERDHIEKSGTSQLLPDGSRVDVQIQKAGDGPRDEQDNGPRRALDGVKRSCGDCSRLSDYRKVTAEEQWAEGKGSFGEGEEASDDESDRRKRRRREEWRSGGWGRLSTSRGNSESALKMYMKSKAGDGVGEGDAEGSGEIVSPTVFGRRMVDIDTKVVFSQIDTKNDQKLDSITHASNRMKRGLPISEKAPDSAKEVIKTSTSSSVDARSSRETLIVCRGNCEPTTRHILAEENVLVSWPTARFTLNILSSTPPSPSPFSTPTSKDTVPQNITFGTFESPVKVVVEIPCGVGKVGGRSKRHVNSEEYEDSKEVSGENGMDVYSSAETLTEGNEKDEGVVGDGETHSVTEIYDESDLTSFMKGAEEGTTEQIWGDSISIPDSRSGNTESLLDTYRSEIRKGSLEGARVRKERVTKFDITDDIAESLSLSSLQIDRMGFSMKREAAKELKGDVEGLTADRPSRRKRAARDISREQTRNSITSRDPKIELSPAPASIPFRLFLVLRYCGPDSTECDEENADHDSIDEWKRPQTVYTEELVDFPICPSYRHQLTLPCEAFGQAGVYVVQIRSNYTFDDDDDSDLSELSVVSQGFIEKRSKRDDGSELLVNKQVNSTETTTLNSTDGGEVTDSVVASQNTVKKCLVSEGCKENAAKSMEESTVTPVHTTMESFTANSKGDSVNRNGFQRTSEGKRGERDAYPWDSPDSWWDGSGELDGEEGSGDWGEGWGNEGGRERRGGSGDGEYSDDPEGGEKLTSPQKFPEPPPRSLWSSSEEIHVHLSKGYVFTVHARSVFPCSDARVKPDTFEPAPSGVPVLFEYPQCILDGSDRVRVFGRARPDVSAILPPFWMGSDASIGAAATLSHPSLKYVAEKKIYKGKHTAWFDCSLFTERYSEYCFAYASEAMTGAVTHVRAQCIPTLPTSEEDRGGWGSWSSWSQCSTTCGSGSRNRYRTCDNPPPRYGAPFCEGTALETERCPPPSGATFEELQEMCPLGLALSSEDGVNRRGSEPSCRCGGCIVHLQGIAAASWGSHNAGPIKTRPRVLASSSQACPGRSFWLLEAEPGHVVGLTVSSILLPCPRRQWLKARDGDSLSSRLILHLPSSANTASVPSNTETLCFSSGPHLLLEFYSFERLEPTCNGGFLAHAHQILANSSAAAIGKEVLLAPTTRAVSRSSISVHFAALAFVLALVALSGGLALNYIFRRKRFIEEMKKREKEEEEMSDSDSDTKCFIARNKDGGSVTSVTSVSDVISLRKLSIGRDGKRREVHVRLREEEEENEEEEEDDEGRDEAKGGKSTAVNTDSNTPAKAICPKVVVIEPGSELTRKIGKVREMMGIPAAEEESGEEGDSEEGVAEERKDGEVTRRRRRKGASGNTRREWRESACPLLEQETVAQSSISLPSSPTEPLNEEPIASPNAPGRPGLSASAPLLLRRSLSFFAAAASASTAGATSDSSSEGGVHSLSAAGRQWWRKKLQRFQNGSVSPVREELEETWRLADPQSMKEDGAGKSKKSSGDATPAKECKEKQNRERLLRAGAVAYYPNPPSSTPSNSPSSTTSPEMGMRGVSGSRLRGRLRARVDERGKCNSEASLAGGASELDLEFDYYDYNVQNAGAAPGSYLGMDPAFLVYIPPFEGSTSPSSEASSASTLQAPPSEVGHDLCTTSAPMQDGGATLRGEYYCINASYARANFQDAGTNGGSSGIEDGSVGSVGEMVSLAEFRRDSMEEGKGSEKETRVEKSPAPEEEDEIKFADEEEEDEVVMVSEKKEEDKYDMIKLENLRLKRPI